MNVYFVRDPNENCTLRLRGDANIVNSIATEFEHESAFEVAGKETEYRYFDARSYLEEMAQAMEKAGVYVIGVDSGYLTDSIPDVFAF